MNNRLDISVVIPVHNGRPYLREQLEALKVQNFEGAWEVIVVDNRSTDGIVAEVDQCSDGFPVPLRTISAHGRVGAAHARNRGAEAARGVAIAFCDADDHVSPGWLAAANAGLESSDIVGGALRRLTQPFDVSAPYLDYSSVGWGPNGRSILSCNMATTAKAFKDLGGFDESMPRYGGEDSEFSIRAAGANMHFSETPDMEVYFRATDGFRARMRKVFLSGIAQYITQRKHPDVFGQELSRTKSFLALLRMPYIVLNECRSKGMAPAARVLVASVGHEWASIWFGRRVPRAILIETVRESD